MNTELLIIVIGSALILIAIVGSITNKSSGQSLISLQFRLAMGIIGLFLIIYSGYSYGAINFQAQIESAVVGNKAQVEYPIKSVQVISPVEDDSVKCRILTKGVYPESHTKDIWVLLKPSDNRYYPQSDYTNTSYKRNGEWQVLTRFGGDKAETYEIIVYETDSLTSAYFSSTIETWKEALSYPGLKKEEIPEGANEIDRISVFLKDNCRGVF